MERDRKENPFVYDLDYFVRFDCSVHPSVASMMIKKFFTRLSERSCLYACLMGNESKF